MLSLPQNPEIPSASVPSNDGSPTEDQANKPPPNDELDSPSADRNCPTPFVVIPTNRVTTIDEPGRGDKTDPDLDGLIKSIQTIGLLHPITVAPDGDHYRLLAGARRLAAMRALDHEDIPAQVVNPDSNQNVVAIAALENLDRKQLTPFQEAIMCAAACDELGGLDVTALAIHRSETWIQARLDILAWPDDCQQALKQERLSMTALKYLSLIEEPGQRAWYLDEAIRNGITASVASAWLRAWRDSQAAGAPLAGTPSPPATGEHTPRPAPQIPCAVCAEHHPLNSIRHLPLCPQCITASTAAADALAQSDPLPVNTSADGQTTPEQHKNPPPGFSGPP